MSAESAVQAAYVVAALLFILSLAGLSRHETAKAGNSFGMAGMAVALAATIGLAARHRPMAAPMTTATAIRAAPVPERSWSTARPIVATRAMAMPAMP